MVRDMYRQFHQVDALLFAVLNSRWESRHGESFFWIPIRHLSQKLPGIENDGETKLQIARFVDARMIHKKMLQVVI